MILSKINDAIFNAAVSLGYDGEKESFISFSEHGDCSSNIAFILAKKIRKSPSDAAAAVKELIESFEGIKSIEIAKGGFVNIFIDEKTFATEMKEILNNKNYGKIESNGIKVNLEFLSANPTGPLVLVNARAAIIGNTLADIMRFNGYDVTTETYINDCGSQIENLGKSVLFHIDSKKDAEFPENGYKGEYIKKIAEKLAAKNEISENTTDRIAKASSFAMKYILDWQKSSLERFKIQFDNWVYESNIRKAGKIESVVELFKEKNLIYEKENAVFLKTTAYSDDKDRVIYKSNGEMTYLLPDIAYHAYKLERNFKYLIDILGPDHHGYIGRIKSAVSAMDKETKFDIIIAQIVTLLKNGQKYEMSKRTGEFITMDEIADELDSDVMKFLILMRKISQPFNFDIEKAKEESMENPVFYVQYAHARICSVFSKAEGMDVNDISGKVKKISNPALKPLTVKLLEFPYAVYSSYSNFEIQKLPTYLYELAGIFHKFYHDNRVISEDIEDMQEKLIVLGAVRETIKRGLRIMGINSKERMEKDEL